MKRIVAIDGPAGAGKSTVAKNLAARLGFLYIDTGAMYRAVAYEALQRQVTLDNEAALEEIAASVELDMQVEAGQNRIYLNGRDVSEEIRMPEVSAAASPVSAYTGVREHMVAKQRLLAKRGKVVLDGRDIGTVVLPEADCKIYLTASLDERARRRYKELRERGIEAELDSVRRDIEERDYRDMHRENSPLRRAEDAVLLDSTGMSIDEVMQKVMKLAAK